MSQTQPELALNEHPSPPRTTPVPAHDAIKVRSGVSRSNTVGEPVKQPGKCSDVLIGTSLQELTRVISGKVDAD